MNFTPQENSSKLFVQLFVKFPEIQIDKVYQSGHNSHLSDQRWVICQYFWGDNITHGVSNFPAKATKFHTPKQLARKSRSVMFFLVEMKLLFFLHWRTDFISKVEIFQYNKKVENSLTQQLKYKWIWT